jgi:hypothetical protein
LGVGGSVGANTQLQSTATSASNVGLVVQGAASQTADLVDIKNSSGTALFKINSSGQVGIGTSGPVAPLDVEATSPVTFSNYEYFNSSTYGHSGGSPTFPVSIKTSGVVLVGLEVDVTSDRRMKENIVKIDTKKALKFIENSKPVFFKWKNQDRSNYGFIAQDLLKLGFDPLVAITPDEKMKRTVDPDGFVSPEGAKFSVNYEEIPALLTTALKNIYHRVLKLESWHVDQRIRSLEADNLKLKKENILIKENATAKDRRIRLLESYLCSKDPGAAFCHD